MSLDRHDFPSGPRALLAADRDREAALDVLAEAVSDGRLTLEEYSGRADLALRARTHAELELLTGDLRAPRYALTAAAPERVSAILGHEIRRGRWNVPGRLYVRSLFGECEIELHEASLDSRLTRIEVTAVLGAVILTVPDGVEVRLSGRAILGGTSTSLRTPIAADAPVIEIHARIFMGELRVRRPTRRQRLRRLLDNRA
jgi:hypothetical protein